jgi:signal transduction histidine kinase
MIVATDRSTYQEIADTAQEVTRSPVVVFNLFDSTTNLVTQEAIAGPEASTYQRAVQLSREVEPTFDPRRMSVPADANRWIAPVYLEARVTDISWQQFTEGVLDEPLGRIAETVTGLTRSILYPIVVGGEVKGSLGFHGPWPFSQDERKLFQSFVRQAELTMENALLLAESRQASQRRTAAEERLRREISEFLHSRVQSKLLVVWHRLGDVLKSIETDPARASLLLTDLREELDRIREHEVRQASHLLHPTIIRVGLVPAVRSLAIRFEDYFRVGLDLDPAVIALDSPINNRIPEPVRLAAYRVIEEALQNVHRHARAGLVEIAITLTTPDYLEVVISDDGSGFDSSEMNPGLGMTSIGDRVEQCNGTWEITGRPGKGTTLRASFRLALPRD